MIKQIEWKNGVLTLLDQRLLPITEKYIECTKYDQIIDAIKTLAVRGAPLIGVSAGMGIVVASKETDKKGEELRQYVIEAEKKLRASRPTAVNLMWALDRMMPFIMADPSDSVAYI